MNETETNAKEKISNEQIEEPEIKAEELLEKERQSEAARIKAKKPAKRIKKAAIITTSIICIIIVFIIILNDVIIPNVKYNDAVALMDAGNYAEAHYAFIALDGYKDSNEKASSIYDKMKLQSAEVGDYVIFGEYEQDNDTSNGKEKIEWLVLGRKGGKILVISKYALDYQEYNTSRNDVTWETCTLRRWLNGTFMSAAFSDEEKTMIPTVMVSADKNSDYSTDPGNTTQDQIFLLSIIKANKYFSSNSERQCKATAYAEAQGVYVNDDNGNCWWWLRSPGNAQISAAFVSNDGDVGGVGLYVDLSNIAVRPALWIDLNKIN